MARKTYSIVLNNYRKQINSIMADLNTLEGERARCRTVGEWNALTAKITAALEAMQKAARYLGDNAQWHLDCGA